MEPIKDYSSLYLVFYRVKNNIGDSGCLFLSTIEFKELKKFFVRTKNTIKIEMKSAPKDVRHWLRQNGANLNKST